VGGNLVRLPDRPDHPNTQQQPDAITELGQIVRHLDQSKTMAQILAERADRAREGLLYVHGSAALVLAPLFASSSAGVKASASFSALLYIPAFPASAAAVLAAGGATLLIGVHRRLHRTTQVGLALMFAFYLTIALGFAITIADHLFRPHDTVPTLYGPVIYAHLALTMGWHIHSIRAKAKLESYQQGQQA
jgi:hypothetical protein